MTRNFNEIFSYWDDKEKAISQRPRQQIRKSKRKPAPEVAQPQSTTIEASPDTTTLINNNNPTVDSNNNNKSGYDNVATTNTVSPPQTPTKAAYDNVETSTTTTTTPPTVESTTLETTTKTGGYDNATINDTIDLTSSIGSTKAAYDNVSGTTTESTQQESIVVPSSPSPSSISHNSYSNYNPSMTTDSTSSSYNDSLTSSTQNNNNYGASQYGGGNRLVGATNSGSSNYNISSYGGSSGYSVYNANTGNTSNPSDPYNIYSEGGDFDDSDSEGNYDDDSDNNTGGGTGDNNTEKKKKQSYIEKDISEKDLVLLETLIKYKARLGAVEEDDDSPVSETIGSNMDSHALFADEEDSNFSSNPYISNHTAFTSSYSHPKFLTEKGIEESGGARSITQSSASSISKKLDNVSLTSWNSEFQRLLEMDDCLEKFERLSSLEHDFVYAAETYGRIIISENFLTNELKTIKPVSVGGIAGGEKYIVQGILFKFALENETFGLYGSDENAMKTAAHELNGCTSFLNCGVKGLHVPLMAFIDYRGFRLMAMSLLPISKKSLIYGSCDAGQTVHNDNPIFNHLFSNAAKIVNLKPHFVQDMSGDIKSINGPIDIEGHQGNDNRYYLLDFARLSPPEPPKFRGAYLYKLLRLELVRKHTKPLCSDAFSPMSSIDIDIHNSEVQEAYDHLMKSIIPSFANWLEVKDQIGLNSPFDREILTSIYNSNKNKSISKMLHSHGINVRYLGEVRSYIQSTTYKAFVTIEAIVRTLKSLARELLRREMKKTHLPSDYPYRNLLLNFLNLLFDEYKGKTELFWSKIVYEKMEKKFQNIYLDREFVKDEEQELLDTDEIRKKIDSGEFIRFKNDYAPKPGYGSGQEMIKLLVETKNTRFQILKQFCKSIGLVLSKVSRTQFLASPLQFVFVDPDIQEIKTLISRLNIIDYADGMSLFYKSMVPGLNGSSKSRLLTISKDRLEESLHSMSTNYNAIFQLGNVIRLMAKYSEEDDRKKELLGQADDKFAELESHRIDQNLLLLSRLHRIKNGLQLYKITKLGAEKEEKFEQMIRDCIELSPSKAYPSYLLAKYFNILSRNNKQEANYDKIEEAYEHVFTIDPNYQKGHIGIAMFYLESQSYNRNFSAEKVSEHITKALSYGNIETLVNKIKPLVDFRPWLLFESSKTIPKVKKMVKASLEAIIDRLDSKLKVSPNLTFVPSDAYFFEHTLLNKLYLDENTTSSNIEIWSNIKPTLSTLILRKTQFDRPDVLFKSVSNFTNLTHLNLGGSKLIDDAGVEMMLTPLLKKLKLYEIQTITDKTIDNIAKICSSLELLDVGGCEAMADPEIFNRIFVNIPTITKLALPTFATNYEVANALSKLQLIRLDLMKCKGVDSSSYSTAFQVCPTLVKYRTPSGIPQFLIGPQMLTSRYTKVNSNEPSLRYSVNNHELFNIKIGYGVVINQGRLFELFYNNLHPLVRFRDPPNLRVGNCFKVCHASMVDKPMSTFNVFRDTNFSGSWRQPDLTNANNIIFHSSPNNSFRMTYHNVLYSFQLFTQTSHAGITFSNQVTTPAGLTVVCSNNKALRMGVDLEVKQKCTPIAAFLGIATGFQ